jgi:beta-lactamase class A
MSKTSDSHTERQAVANPRLKRKKKSYRRLPPGQRLLCFLGLACLLTLGQATKLPADTPLAGPDINFGQATSLTGTGQGKINSLPMPFKMSENYTALLNELKQESDKPKLRSGVFVLEPATGRYIDMSAGEPFCAASLIKVPVLVDLLMTMDKGTIDPEKTMVIRRDLIAGGSGILQWRAPGSKIKLRDVTDLMITISDNTATNMIIDLLGGIDKVNKDIADLGLTTTHISNWLPDLEGTNKTSPYELAYLFAKMQNGELISKEARFWMYDMMSRTKTRSLLPMGLEPGSKIFHKTGDIGSMVGDAGIIETLDGKTYIVAAQVERPFNDRRANQIIRHMSRLIYYGVVNNETDRDKISFADMDGQFPVRQATRQLQQKLAHHVGHQRHTVVAMHHGKQSRIVVAHNVQSSNRYSVYGQHSRHRRVRVATHGQIANSPVVAKAHHQLQHHHA